MRVLTKRLMLRYEVALYLSYLHINNDDEIEGIPFEFEAYFLICLRPK